MPLAVARDADLMLSSETLVETNVMKGAWDASTNTVQQGMKQGVAIVRDTTKNLSEAAGKGVKDAQGKFMDAVAKGAEGFGEVAGTSFAVTVGTGEFVRDTVGKGTNAAKQALQAAVPLLRADERATGDQSDDAMNSPNSLSPPPSAAPSSRRPVLESTTVLKACADGSDIQIEKLIAGSLLLCDCLEKLGPFAVILRDVRHNLRKVERSPARKAETHLRALLKAEIAQEMHPEAGKLEDNSAATGMLWTVRFMRFWADVCTTSLKARERRRKEGGETDEPVPFRQHVKDSYDVRPAATAAAALAAARDARAQLSACLAPRRPTMPRRVPRLPIAGVATSVPREDRVDDVQAGAARRAQALALRAAAFHGRNLLGRLCGVGGGAGGGSTARRGDDEEARTARREEKRLDARRAMRELFDSGGRGVAPMVEGGLRSSPKATPPSSCPVDAYLSVSSPTRPPSLASPPAEPECANPLKCELDVALSIEFAVGAGSPVA